MSKLYDTLERLNKMNEGGGTGPNATRPPLYLHKKKNILPRPFLYVALFLALSILLIGGLYYLFPQLKNLKAGYLHIPPKKIEGIVAPEAEKKIVPRPGLNKQVARAKRATSQVKGTRLDPVLTNNRAVKLLKEKAYWEALFLLEQVIEKRPDFEPAYENSIYGLVRLGLYGAAQEYCKRLRERFGETEWLRKNRDALIRLGIDPGGPKEG